MAHPQNKGQISQNTGHIPQDTGYISQDMAQSGHSAETWFKVWSLGFGFGADWFLVLGGGVLVIDPPTGLPVASAAFPYK